MFKKSIFCLLAIVVITFFYNGCKDDMPISPPSSNQITVDAGSGCSEPNIFGGSPGTVCVQNLCPGDVETIDLWAGNPPSSILVGKVELYPTTTAGVWTVKYIFTDPLFTATSIHFAISCTLAGIPQTPQHNPKVGQFPYSFNGPFANPFTFNITLPGGCVNCYYVAAHAGGTISGVEAFNLSIPAGCVSAQVNGGWSSGQPDTGCYWQFTLSNAGTFNGLYCGWCVDLGHGMLPGGGPFTCARIYSSYQPLPSCDLGFPYIEHPENFDKVNYLINHFQPGQTVNLTNSDCSLAGGTGVLTVVDIQKAIWSLLDEGPGNTYNEFSDPLRVNAILCDVNANGEGFVPNCDNGDQIVFVVIPDGQNCPYTVQPIIGFRPCGGGTGVTAWGDGKYGGDFGGSSWATYFKWCTTCP